MSTSIAKAAGTVLASMSRWEEKKASLFHQA